MENTTLTREEVLAIVQEALAANSAQPESAALDKREEALAAQEAALNAREKQDRALQLLREHQLPEEMAAALALMTDEEMAAAVIAWEDLFRARVQQAVEERLRGNAPMTGVMQDVSALSDADYYASLYPHLT